MRGKLRTSFGHLGLVFAVLAGVLAVAFGTGYRASTALLGDGSAWLVDGRSAAHVNGTTGEVDARLSDAEDARRLATGDERLQIVQTPTGAVYVVNTDTGQVTSIDTTTMRPAGRGYGGSPQSVEVLTGGGRAYVADTERATVTVMDPKTMQPQSAPLRIDGRIRTAVADTSGTVWILTDDGSRVHRVEGSAVAATVPLDGPDKRAQLTLVGDRPVVLTGRGEVLVIGDGGVEKTLPVPIAAGVPAMVNDPSVPGSRVWISLPGSGQLAWVDLDSGDGSVTDVPYSRSLGPAVVAAGRVYVPDHSRGTVAVVDARTGKYLDTITVPGNAIEFDLFVKDDRVWINPPSESDAIIVQPDGQDERVEKGSGDADEDDPGPSPSPSSPSGPEPTHPDPTSTQTPKPHPPGNAAIPPPTSAPHETAIVPGVVGRQKDDACRVLQLAGFNCRFQGVGTRPGGQPDEVVSTQPAGGVEHVKGGYVVISHLGAITVPNLVGQPYQPACDQLRQSGVLECVLAPQGVAPSPGEAGRVLTQDPPPGASVGEGTKVRLQYYDTVRVPNVVRLDYDVACQQVQSAGLRCNRLDAGTAQNTGRRVNEVVDQSPAGGSLAGLGATIDLKTLNGIGKVPNVVGLDIGQARTEVERAGYVFQPQIGAPARQPNTAYSQTPDAGVARELGQPVVVTYEDTAPEPVYRYRRSSGERVWVIRVGPDTSGLSDYDRDPTPLGWAYSHGSNNTNEFTQEIHDWVCHDCYGYYHNHKVNNGAPLGPPWTDNGRAGLVFRADYGGMRKLVRLVNDSNGKVAYAYATRDVGGNWDGAGNAYTTQYGFRTDASLGWIWPP
jgi:beta-lactam-binding protein with PASTA domain